MNELMFDKKGVSPLISAVILLAVVIAVGIMVSGQLLDITSTTGEGAEERARDMVDCSLGDLEIDMDHTNMDDVLEGDNVSIWVANTGREDMFGLRMQVHYEVYDDDDDDPKDPESDASPLRSEAKTYDVEPDFISVAGISELEASGNPSTDVADDEQVSLTRVAVTSTVCPEVKTEVAWDDTRYEWR